MVDVGCGEEAKRFTHTHSGFHHFWGPYINLYLLSGDLRKPSPPLARPELCLVPMREVKEVILEKNSSQVVTYRPVCVGDRISILMTRKPDL